MIVRWLANDVVFAVSGIATALLVLASATLAWAAVNLRVKGRHAASVTLAVLAAVCTFLGTPGVVVCVVTISIWQTKAPPESQSPMSGWVPAGVLLVGAAWLWYMWRATQRWHARQRLGYLLNEIEREESPDD